jgi:hypothetical protein
VGEVGIWLRRRWAAQAGDSTAEDVGMTVFLLDMAYLVLRGTNLVSTWAHILGIHIGAAQRQPPVYKHRLTSQ